MDAVEQQVQKKLPLKTHVATDIEICSTDVAVVEVTRFCHIAAFGCDPNRNPWRNSCSSECSHI